MASTYEQLELDRQLCFALHRASRAVVRSYGPLLEASGLTYPQYLVLLVLWEEPDRPFTVGEVGGRLHLDSGTLTPLLKRLEGLGHVRRTRDTADERRVLVALTPEGLALRAELAEVPLELFSGMGLEPDDARRLHGALVGLAARLEADEAIGSR
ncbi:MarR family transcriptional regulator [Aquihabitans sp. G128]|uniref:MarR family winged helix-turn-helix transcriptional regulator n=1 Tax=Aquihabitans sp. G128 TaxID=2849779 RepID=UPI001C24FE48|nr:MarR family transcriptional regulator [Aquihabitans sp. G128]QXC59756.1 MarR family transcriptional regulator [Aquihabitans sp. G128]